MGWGPARLREEFGSLWVGISPMVSRLNKEVGGRWTDLCNSRFVGFDKGGVVLSQECPTEERRWTRLCACICMILEETFASGESTSVAVSLSPPDPLS
jgi:hypothetical protein